MAVHQQPPVFRTRCHRGACELSRRLDRVAVHPVRENQSVLRNDQQPLVHDEDAPILGAGRDR